MENLGTEKYDAAEKSFQKSYSGKTRIKKLIFIFVKLKIT